MALGVNAMAVYWEEDTSVGPGQLQGEGRRVRGSEGERERGWEESACDQMEGGGKRPFRGASLGSGG